MIMNRLLLTMIAWAVIMPFVGMAQEVYMCIDESILLDADEQPVFPGGLEGLVRFASEHVQYPANAQAKGIQGRVVLEFVVTKTGQVSDVKVVESVDPELDAEAVRICQMLPAFEPGKVNGKPVNVMYRFPFSFKLDSEVPDITDDMLDRANHGDCDAQYNVGYCYYAGQGVNVDLIVARYYLGMAAQQGHTKAQELLEKSKQVLNNQPFRSDNY